MPRLLWHETSFFRSLTKDCSNLITFYDKQGVSRTYSLILLVISEMIDWLNILLACFILCEDLAITNKGLQNFVLRDCKTSSSGIAKLRPLLDALSLWAGKDLLSCHVYCDTLYILKEPQSLGLRWNLVTFQDQQWVDWIVFYAVSTILQQYSGDTSNG